MYYIGLDVHKKTISYCVKDASGQVHREGTVRATRNELDGWVRTLPQHELALIHEKEKQKGNGNRATLAVARKMVAYLLAVDRRQRDFVPAEGRSTAAA